MGQRLSCIEPGHEHPLFSAVKDGEFDSVQAMVDDDPAVLGRFTVHGRLSGLHVAAANGQIEIISLMLDRAVDPDVLNRHKQTPLMLAAMHGKISCVEKLIQAGANILLFDSLHGRTCLHYAANYGHSDCLQVILSAAHSTPVADSWGFNRFVNIRDGSGATPLHLAAQQGRSECIHILLDRGALVCASTSGYGHLGNTPLHLAAHGGSLDCVRELLAFGADRLQRDASGRTPYMVALKHKHEACAALLNPLSPEPLIWPSPLKFISDLDPEARELLEKALIEVNKEREKAILKETIHSSPSPRHSDCGAADDLSEASEVELCCICFEQVCTIEVQPCGHQMCAHCTLALCCHNKTNLTTTCPKSPLCPFCRSSITQLVLAKLKSNKDTELDFSHAKPRKSCRQSFNLSEGSSSFKGLSAIGSFRKMGRGSSAKVDPECNEGLDKP